MGQTHRVFIESCPRNAGTGQTHRVFVKSCPRNRHDRENLLHQVLISLKKTAGSKS